MSGGVNFLLIGVIGKLYYLLSAFRAPVLGGPWYAQLCSLDLFPNKLRNRSSKVFFISCARSPTPVQEVKHTSVEETAQPVWPEDMAQTMQKPSNEDTDTVPPWGELYKCL